MNAERDKPLQHKAAVQRVVGIAALRRLHRLVDAEQAQTAAQRKRACWLLAGILLMTTIALGFVLRGVLFG